MNSLCQSLLRKESFFPRQRLSTFGKDGFRIKKYTQLGPDKVEALLELFTFSSTCRVSDIWLTFWVRNALWAEIFVEFSTDHGKGLWDCEKPTKLLRPLFKLSLMIFKTYFGLNLIKHFNSSSFNQNLLIFKNLSVLFDMWSHCWKSNYLTCHIQIKRLTVNQLYESQRKIKVHVSPANWGSYLGLSVSRKHTNGSFPVHEQPP